MVSLLPRGHALSQGNRTLSCKTLSQGTTRELGRGWLRVGDLESKGQSSDPRPALTDLGHCLPLCFLLYDVGVVPAPTTHHPA